MLLRNLLSLGVYLSTWAIPLAKGDDTKGPVSDKDSSANKPYLISFHEQANDRLFEDAQKWLEGKNCTVSESVNESYIKFIVATLGKEDLVDLEKKRAEFGIDEIEVDDFWEKTEL